MKKLVTAHQRMRMAERNLDRAIRECFPVGSEVVHTKGGRPICVQVEMVSASGIKVWNPNSGKSQWVHYFHFLPPSSPAKGEA